MSKFFLFSKINSKKPELPTNAKWYQRLSLNYFSLNIIFLGIILLLFVAYISLVNNTSASGFNLDKLQTQLSLVQDQNKNLDLQVHSLQSMEHIKTISQDFSLEEVENPQYLSGSAAVALSE